MIFDDSGRDIGRRLRAAVPLVTAMQPRDVKRDHSGSVLSINNVLSYEVLLRRETDSLEAFDRSRSCLREQVGFLLAKLPPCKIVKVMYIELVRLAAVPC